MHKANWKLLHCVALFCIHLSYFDEKTNNNGSRLHYTRLFSNFVNNTSRSITCVYKKIQEGKSTLRLELT